jgi:Pectate lyase superfamily protein
MNVRDFGAVGDGVTDDTVPFRTALEEAGRIPEECFVPPGIYLIGNPDGITEPHRSAVTTGVRFHGENRDTCILKIAAMPTYHLLQCGGDNWIVDGLTFDMGDFTRPAGSAAVLCKGTGWSVRDCAVIRSGRWGIQVQGGRDWSISDCYIQRTVPGAQPPVGAILVTREGAAWSENGRLENNRCEGGGISFTGSNGSIARNRIKRSGYGSGIYVQSSLSSYAPTIYGNICSDGLSGYDDSQGGKWWSVNGFEIWAPDALIYNNIAHDNDGGGIAVGGRASIVAGNVAYNNSRGRANGAGITARIMAESAASGSVFIGNRSYDARYPDASATQAYGYSEQPGGLRNIISVGNDYSRNKLGEAIYNSSGGRQNMPAREAQRLQLHIDGAMGERLFALSENVRLSSQIREIMKWLPI